MFLITFYSNHYHYIHAGPLYIDSPGTGPCEVSVSSGASHSERCLQLPLSWHGQWIHSSHKIHQFDQCQHCTWVKSNHVIIASGVLVPFIYGQRISLTHLQWTTTGLFPVCAWVLVTWSMRLTIPAPELGAPSSGQAVNWYCFTVRDIPSVSLSYMNKSMTTVVTVKITIVSCTGYDLSGYRIKGAT